MLHLYKSRLTCLLRIKNILFWTLFLPIALGALCYFMLLNQDGAKTVSGIAVAVVNSEAAMEELADGMRRERTGSGDALFQITECEKEEEARYLLYRDEVSAVILADGSTLFLEESGLKETVIKVFLDRYHQAASKGETAAMNYGTSLQAKNYIEVLKDKEDRSDYKVVYFYALLAMACMSGAAWGLYETANLEADQSLKGARLHLAPISKFKFMIGHFSAALTIQFGEMVILYYYLKEILKTDFGEYDSFVLLTLFVGSIISISMGAMIAALLKGKGNLAVSVTVLLVIAGGLLAGVIKPSVKYFVDTKLPLLSCVNPAALMTNAFYSLYYDNDFRRFYMVMFILTGIALVITAVTAVLLRRKDYAGI